MSDVNPAELSTAGARTVPDDFPVEVGEFAHEADFPKKSEREGLPRGYRMRADAHYVDQLSARPAEGRDRRDSRDRRSDQLLTQIADDLSTIASAAALLAADSSPSARRVSVDLVRAHAWRAAFLVRAHALLDPGVQVSGRARSIGAILTAVRDGFAPECRISTFGLHLHAPDWNASVAVDEQAVVTGVSGAVFATLGLLGPADGATIRITASASAGDLRFIEVSQDEAGAVPTTVSRFFDPTFTDRPGGWTAALAAAAARAISQHHGGEASLIVNGKRGTTIRLTFNALRD